LVALVRAPSSKFRLNVHDFERSISKRDGGDSWDKRDDLFALGSQ
jgi:hypothetical protein